LKVRRQRSLRAAPSWYLVSTHANIPLGIMIFRPFSPARLKRQFASDGGPQAGAPGQD
jgi:hypothetical protein